jgi:serine/threonine-protein kinase
MADTPAHSAAGNPTHNLIDLPAGADDMPRSVLLPLLRSDLRWRWRHGQRVSVEVYLNLFPKLREDAEALIELVSCEFLAQEELGVKPDLADFRRRFPTVADSLSLRLEFQRDRSGQRVAESPKAVPAYSAHPPTSTFTGFPDQPPPPVPLDEVVTLAHSGTPRPERLIPGYEILGEVGRGGVGVVYRARQLCLNRVVAIKMIVNPDPNEHRLARFHTEAEAMARLRHPNIVEVYEAGEVNGRAFITLEYCAGGSLADRLSDRRSPREAAALAEALARAMQAAHDAGVIHRDLKPGNILLTTDGIPKISDFGLAKQLGMSAHLTQSGAIIGTPNYMAPEQAAGHSKKVGPSADIYSLGAILYHLLTGQPPFQADTVWGTVAQVNRGALTPPRQLHAEIPDALEAICLKCLRKDPAERYSTAQAMADDLRHWLDAAPAVPAAPVPAPQNKPGRVAICPNVRPRWDTARDGTRRLNDVQKALVGSPVLVSLMADGRIIRQRELAIAEPEAPSSVFVWEDVPPGCYDIRFEGDGMEMVIKRGLQVCAGDEMRVMGDFVAGRGTRDVEYGPTGATIDELRVRLRRLEAEVAELKGKKVT